jgi:antirestriction protein
MENQPRQPHEDHQQHGQGQRPDGAIGLGEGPEQDRTDQRAEGSNWPTPKIYASSLSDYNAGELHGAWIRADQDEDEIEEAITAMLERSSQPGAEEWAIHDYEGFSGIQLSEYEPTDTIARLGTGLAEHGPAFAHWTDCVGTGDQDQLDQFNQHYLGHWDSMEDYAEQLLDDLGIDTEGLGPEMLRPYIRLDLEAFARDLACELHVGHDGDGVHVFDA